MIEKIQTTAEQSNLKLDSFSFDLNENNFTFSQLNPENIFCSEVKDSSDEQLASKVFCFPFNLDSFKLIYLKDEKDPELIDPFTTVIIGDIEKIRFSEPVIKMVFYAKDRSSLLQLSDYNDEMESLTKISGIEFICICMNKMFIQYEDDNNTKEAFNSLQKNYKSLDFLYEEDLSMNSLDNQFKGSNSLFSSEKKNNVEDINSEKLSSPEKDGKNLDEFLNNLDTNFTSEKETNFPSNNIFKEPEFFSNNIWNSGNKQENETLIQENNKKEETSQKQQNIFNQANSPIFPSQSFQPFYFPFYNLTNNNTSTTKSQMNPLFFMQPNKMNPFTLQATLALQQNMMKLQQMSLNSNDKNNLNNINNGFNGKNNKIKNVTEKGSSISNNKESSTNSNTSSTVSSKESSPTINYHNKSYGTNNVNIPCINFGLFNGFNNINSIQNLNMINNNKLNNNKEFNNDLLNLSNTNNKTGNSDSSLNCEELKINSNLNLQQIVINNTFKEYIPKNYFPNMSFPQNTKTKEEKNLSNPQTPEKGVEFHTNSTRDYKFKYVSRYIVQIENEKNFPVTRMIIGNSGKLLRNILVKNCINNGDDTTKIRLRGKGSGYKEGPKNEESQDPMELCISSLNLFSFLKCSQEIENLLRNVYYQYYLYQCNNRKKNKDNKDETPIVMKKILKYQYVVNRYNTLAKEEKRRKKEEEMKQMNQVNKNNNSNENNSINHE